ncbi:MAG: hypothetical protein ABSA90_02245 [Xanthobacteraceae bacterium]
MPVGIASKIIFVATAVCAPWPVLMLAARLLPHLPGNAAFLPDIPILCVKLAGWNREPPPESEVVLMGEGHSPKPPTMENVQMANEQNPQRDQQQQNNPQRDQQQNQNKPGQQHQGGQGRPGEQQGGQNKPGQGGQNKPGQGGQQGGGMNR